MGAGVVFQVYRIWARCVGSRGNDRVRQDGEYRKGKQAACVFRRTKVSRSARSRTSLWVRAWCGFSSRRGAVAGDTVKMERLWQHRGTRCLILVQEAWVCWIQEAGDLPKVEGRAGKLTQDRQRLLGMQKAKVSRRTADNTVWYGLAARWKAALISYAKLGRAMRGWAGNGSRITVW